jgi:molybdopterin-biosynthesis enzyme MoeA-like protein
MFEAAAAELRRGKTIHSRSMDVLLRESDLAEALERIAAAHPEVEIGSYPFARDGRFGANLVVRGTDEETVQRVLGEIASSMAALEGATAPQR